MSKDTNDREDCFSQLCEGLSKRRSKRSRKSRGRTTTSDEHVNEDTTKSMLEGLSLWKEQIHRPTLLTLPREVRDSIWSCVLKGDYQDIWPESSNSASENLSILRVCHQTGDESIPVLYEEGRFRIDNVRGWLKIGHKIKNVRIANSPSRDSLRDDAMLLRLCQSDIAKKSCYIDLKCRSGPGPLLHPVDVEMIMAAFLRFQEATIQVSRRDRCCGKDRCLKEQWYKQQLIDMITDLLKKTEASLGESSVKLTRDSVIIVFKLRAKANVEAYISENPGKDAEIRLRDAMRRCIWKMIPNWTTSDGQ